MNYFRLKILGLVCVGITGAALFSPRILEARRVRKNDSLEIANLVMKNTDFLTRHSLFLAGIPDNISQAVAEAIRATGLAIKDAHFRRDFLIMNFMDFVEMVKSLGGGWDLGKIQESPDLYFKMRGLEDKNIILYEYYSYSEQYGHTADDVLQAIRWLRTWRNTSNVQHILLSAERINLSIFTDEQIYNTPLVNYLKYLCIERNEKGSIILE